MLPSLHQRSRQASVASLLYTLTAAGTAVLLVICIIAYPDAAFRASLQGLKVWWTIIFPALLPFLILSEMLLAFGWIHGLGVLLNPLMRLLFRLPGVGGWAWAVGWTAGYPAGTEAVVKLRRQQLISRHDGDRLLSLSHASSPVFIVAVVGVGFLQQADTGLFLAIIHWTSSLISMLVLQLIFRPASGSAADSVSLPAAKQSTKTRFSASRVLDAMESAHRADGRPLGQLLGEAVTAAVATLMMIGGYIMIFSVIIQVTKLVIPHQVGTYIMNGLLEVNLGAFTIGNATFTSLVFQIALVSAVLGWSGISAHLQVHSLIKETDLRYSRFLISRVIHAVIAFLMTYVCWIPYRTWFHPAADTESVWNPISAAPDAPASVSEHWTNSLLSYSSGWHQLIPLLIAVVSFILLLIVISSVIALLKRLSR